MTWLIYSKSRWYKQNTVLNLARERGQTTKKIMEGNLNNCVGTQGESVHQWILVSLDIIVTRLEHSVKLYKSSCSCFKEAYLLTSNIILMPDRTGKFPCNVLQRQSWLQSTVWHSASTDFAESKSWYNHHNCLFTPRRPFCSPKHDHIRYFTKALYRVS